MDRIDQLSKYFTEKQRKKLDGSRDKVCGLPDMTPEEIRQSCIENDGYETPELNDKLYLHFRGFKRIQNLEPYIGCKALWLDSNGLEIIEGLDSLIELRCLYLGKNLLTKIDGLGNLQELTLLDLSNNRLSSITNLACCPKLQTINISRNALSSAESINHLILCKSLQTVDITNNRLEGDDIIQIFSQMESLVTLSINGNPITQSPGFRKRMIVSSIKLGYLDRPIDEIERIGAVAFVEGGVEAERTARDLWKEKQKTKKIDEMAAFRKWQSEQQELRQQLLQQRQENNDNNNSDAKSNTCSYLSDFTAEEQRVREEEANRAAAAERKMLDIGIGAVAAKYWNITSSNDRQNTFADGGVSSFIQRSSYVDPLEAAVTAALEEDDKTAVAKEEILMNGDAEVSAELDRSTAHSSVAEKGDDEKSDPAFDHVAVGASAEQHTDKEEAVNNNDISQTELRSSDVDTENEAGETTVVQTNDNAEFEQAVRDERVAESLRIFYAQQAVRRTKDQSGGEVISSSATRTPEVVPSPPPRSYTWNETSPFLPPPPTTRPLYWSEEMDMQLGAFVREFAFDFDRIGIAMSTRASNGLLGEGNCSELADRLTGDACRVRWSQLDAKQWAEVSPTSSALDTIYKVCIKPDNLGKGHGAQPDFHALSSLAAGSFPSYLTPPTHFPSVRDQPDSDEEHDVADASHINST